MFIKLCKLISKVMAGVKMIIDLEDNIMKIQICQCVAEIYKKFPFRNIWKPHVNIILWPNINPKRSPS